MRTGVWVALGCAGAIAVGAGVWLALGRPIPDGVASMVGLADTPAPTKPEKTLGIKVATAARTSVPVSFEYTGTIVSPADAQLQARVTGTIVSRPFEPGSRVKTNDLLFKIDTRPFEVALKSAQAQESEAQAALSFADAQVVRAKTLNKKGYETAQRLQKLNSQQTSAQASLQQAKASIAREQLNIDYATVRAPFDGRVSLSQINVGDLVTANATKLASVVQIDPIDLQIALSAEDSEAVRKAMATGDAKVTLLDSNGNPVREAVIYKLDNRFDPRTARRLVRALVHNSDERYLPGEFVRSRVQVGKEQRILVPTVALSTQLDQQIVYSVDGNGKIAVLPVETGKAFGDNTAILEGVSPGTRIAVDHLQDLQPGKTVTVDATEPLTAGTDSGATGHTGGGGTKPTAPQDSSADGFSDGAKARDRNDAQSEGEDTRLSQTFKAN